MKLLLLWSFYLIGCSNHLFHLGNAFDYYDYESPRSLADELGIDTRIGGTNTGFNFPSDNSNSCSTPTGESGDCVALQACPDLLHRYQTRGIRTREDIRFFRSRICRYFRNTVNLCCVKRATSPPPVAPVGTDPRRPSSSTLLPSKGECGFSSVSRIAGGKEIVPGSHPWLVGVGFPSNTGPFRVLCGGTLITKRHVLTAAHCFESAPGLQELTHVRLGEHSLSMNNEREPPVSIAIASRKSPGYNTVSHVGDLELLVLERDVTFTSFIRPACLPIGFESRNFENAMMIIVGWGDTFHRSFRGSDVPLGANVSVVPKPQCREAYVRHPQVPLDNTQLCAGIGTTDACQGDSGGPMLYLDTKEHIRYFLIGVVSFGIGCANPTFPGVYTYIPEYITWITNNL